MENTKIEWTDNSFNPWWGCVKVSPGCKMCYAETMDNRLGGHHWGPGTSRKPMSESYWAKPLKWNEKAAKAGKKIKVFCASMADVFEDNHLVVLHRARLFKLIEQTPNLIWQILTKRPENITRFLPVFWLQQFPQNVWFGTTTENQEQADIRIPELLKVRECFNVPVLFISCEPLIGPVSLSKWLAPKEVTVHATESFKQNPEMMDTLGKLANFAAGKFSGIDWVIVGGESGNGARPMHPEWARSIINQCETAGVPVLFKQWGEYGSIYNDGKTHNMTFVQFKSFDHWVNKASTWVSGGICLDKNGKQLHIGKDFMEARDNDNFPVTIMHKIGKKEAGNVIDGKQHLQFPKHATN